jgi:hypothetical protein
MSLLDEVVEILREAASPHAMIGATALASFGISRSTQDFDLLTTDRRVLRGSFWKELESESTEVEIRHGDLSDPLVGVVRITRGASRPIDLIVGEATWQREIIDQATPLKVVEFDVPVVDEVGFILLKLFADGPQDRWDIEQVLLAAADRAELTRRIEKRLEDLTSKLERAWQRFRVDSE